jgi:hypothetical protein
MLAVVPAYSFVARRGQPASRSPRCARPTPVTVESDGDGTDYSVEFGNRSTKERYGSFSVWAASFDVTFLAMCAAAGALRAA